MKEIINIILVIFLGIGLITPFIIIPLILIYNSMVSRARVRVEVDICNKTVKSFIKILKFGPLTKYDKKWEVFTETFNNVSKSNKVDYKLKLELYNLLIQKGCSEKELNFKVKNK